jgi:hypothetical protein
VADVLNDYGKLIILLVALSGGIVLAIIGVVAHDQGSMVSGVGICTTIIGYVTGNGRLAVRREPPSTLLAPKLPTDEFVRIDDLHAFAQDRRDEDNTARREAAGAKRTAARKAAG